jgi:hypothetical protein
MRVPPPPHQGDDAQDHQGGDQHQEDDADNRMMGMMAIAEHEDSLAKDWQHSSQP